MQLVGDSAKVFRARVELVVPDADASGVRSLSAGLTAHLRCESDVVLRSCVTDGDSGGSGADQGRRQEPVPIVGLSFLVRGDALGEAAELAVATAAAAAEECGLDLRRWSVEGCPKDRLGPSPRGGR